MNWGVCWRTGDGAGVVLVEESDPGGKCSTSKVSELLDSFLRCALIKDLIYSSGRVS